MRLSELNGKIEGDNLLLFFECPIDKSHGILIALNKPYQDLNEGRFWNSTGDSIENITLSPSVDCTKKKDGTPSGCHFHGFVSNGNVTF